MRKQIETFMKLLVEDKEEVREEYLQKLEEIRKGKFIRIEGFVSDTVYLSCQL